MNKQPWTPWHQVFTLRDDVRDLSLTIFAADLYDVVRNEGASVYRDPAEFFATTYTTENMGLLARDVLQRLAGAGPRAVRQLARSYGGGKTHAMVTLYHLANDLEKNPPAAGRDAVRELREYIRLDRLPAARIAVLPFDKIDLEKGMETPSPVPGEPARWLRQPWSILAYQIAGRRGLEILHPEGRDEERDSAPAENLLVPLLDAPRAEGRGTLILVDEVLMYARAMIDIDPAWGIQLINFFQYLTQAAVKAPRTALVISLLAHEPARNDAEGRQFAQDLANIIQRESEEDVLPIQKADVAQVLRRRFFTPESLSKNVRADVLAALQGIQDWDEPTKKDSAAVDRYSSSYPFHPDLTEVFFQKWTQIETFQYARGILRTFALALRDAAAWNDSSPLVGPNVFLTDPKESGVSAALQELTGVAARANVENTPVNWNAILTGELEKARAIQEEARGSLPGRVIEQAVVATFLHSQPEGQKAALRDLLLLISPTRPDKIETRKALRRWTELSWFLDEREVATAKTGPDGEKTLPESWRLGFRENLTQIFAQKRKDIRPETIDSELDAQLQKDSLLTKGVGITGAIPHKLVKPPVLPSDVPDDGQFRFVVLGPKAASRSRVPSKEALRFLNEKTGPDAPRVNKNMVVLAVPDTDKWAQAQDRMRDLKAWEEVRDSVTLSELNHEQRERLTSELKQALGRVPEAIRQAYTLAVAYTKQGEPEAITITDDGNSLFSSIKANKALNIQETPLTPDTLLPGETYGVWGEGEEARPVKYIVDAFAQQPRLPKMLNRQSLLDTIVAGCEQGFYALRWHYTDGSLGTIWRDTPGEGVLANYDKSPYLEAVLPEAADLTKLSAALLIPGRLPGLWTDPARLTIGDLYHYFRGGHTVKGQKEGGWAPTLTIPRADTAVVDAALRAAVMAGHIALVAGPAAFFKEDIPAGLLTAAAFLTPPPKPISVRDLAPSALPDLWDGRPEVTADALWKALSARAGSPLPWTLVRQAINDAIHSRILQTTPTSPAPGDASQATRVHLAPVEASTPTPTDPTQPGPASTHIVTAELQSHQIMDLADNLSTLMQTAAGCGLTFHLTVELGRDAAPTPEIVQQINAVLAAIAPDLTL